MTQIRINQLEMMYPDSFHEMSEEKKAGLGFYKDSPGACMEDPENHIIVTVGWTKPGTLTVLPDQNHMGFSLLHAYMRQTVKKALMGGITVSQIILAMIHGFQLIIQ